MAIYRIYAVSEPSLKNVAAIPSLSNLWLWFHIRPGTMLLRCEVLQTCGSHLGIDLCSCKYASLGQAEYGQPMQGSASGPR